MHPVIEEICRAKSAPERPDVFKRWQLQLRNEVQPLLDAFEQMRDEGSRYQHVKAQESSR